jgi:hypothetical protein
MNCSVIVSLKNGDFSHGKRPNNPNNPGQHKPVLLDALSAKPKNDERQDGNGFLEVLPAGDIVGSHGKTYLLAAFDELRGYRT